MSVIPESELTTEQRIAVRKVLGTIPIVLLPRRSMGTKPLSVNDLIEIIDHMGKVGLRFIEENEALHDEKNQSEADIKAAGRILKKLLDAAK